MYCGVNVSHGMNAASSVHLRTTNVTSIDVADAKDRWSDENGLVACCSTASETRPVPVGNRTHAPTDAVKVRAQLKR
jgi:hypothetical protein